MRFKFASPLPLAEDSARHWEDGPSPPEDAGAGPYGQRAGGSGGGGGRAHRAAEETMQTAPVTGRADLLQEAVAFVTLGGWWGTLGGAALGRWWETCQKTNGRSHRYRAMAGFVLNQGAFVLKSSLNQHDKRDLIVDCRVFTHRPLFTEVYAS